jgi:hyperpolarization activated cyclic nucleotide-gated potassium channel 2
MPSSGLLMLFEIFIDTFFMIDVCINLYTGYYKKGSLVMKRRHIMCRYLKTWFIIDLLASIPFTWFISDDDLYNEDGELMRKEAMAHHTSQLLRLLKLFRFMRIIRLIRLFKLRGLVNRVSIIICYILFSLKRSFSMIMFQPS